MIIRKYQSEDCEQTRNIWNQVVEDGVAFPQTEQMSAKEADDFFKSQSYTGVCEEDGQILGMYILHPNNVGRCGHIANASYAVSRDARGRGLGEKLVRDCLNVARAQGFRILQFNAVVATNTAAIHLYEKLDFVRLGTIPGGFHMDDGHYEDIILYYHLL